MVLYMFLLYGFVYVFACLDAKKMQEKRRKSRLSYFLGNHVLGGRTIIFS